MLILSLLKIKLKNYPLMVSSRNWQTTYSGYILSTIS